MPCVFIYAILETEYGMGDLLSPPVSPDRSGGKNMAITVNQIAEECGVSRTTVLRALNGRGSVARETKERILQVADTHDKHFVHTILGTGVAPAGGGMWCPPCPVPHGRRPCRRGCPGRDGSRTGDSIAARRGSRKGMAGKGGMPGGWNMLPGEQCSPGERRSAGTKKGRGHPRPFGLCGLRTA